MAAADLVEAADGTAWVAADGMRLIGMHGQAPVRTLFADDPTANEVTALTAGSGGSLVGRDRRGNAAPPRPTCCVLAALAAAACATTLAE
jgi:hypothetical protein